MYEYIFGKSTLELKVETLVPELTQMLPLRLNNPGAYGEISLKISSAPGESAASRAPVDNLWIDVRVHLRQY